jgi:PAS domain S-box-containing protein
MRMAWNNSQPELNSARMREPSLTTGRDMPDAALLNNLRVGLYTCDLRGNITSFNDRAAELWGYRPSNEVRFWAFHKSWQPDGSEIHPDISPMAMALRQGRTFHGLEMWVEQPDGNRYFAGIAIDLIRNESDAVVGAAAMIRDITDEKAATKGFITDTERRYRTLIKTLPVAAYVCDLEGRLTLYNDAAVRLWGREPRDEDKWCGALRVYKLDGTPVPPDQCPMAQTVRSGRAVEDEVVLLEQPDGTMLYVLPCPRPLYDPAGKLEGAVNVLIDITTEKRSQQILEESVNRLNLAVNAAELGTWDMDLTSGTIAASERHRKIMDVEKEGLWTRQDCMAKIHPDDQPMVDELFNGALKSGTLFFEARVVRKDKGIRWIRVNGVTLYSSGQPSRMIGTTLDITPQREISEQLEQKVARRTRELTRLNKLLEKSNHDLEQFAYIASHDLQEPLRKIQTFATLAENVDNEEGRKRYLTKVRDEAQGMSALVRDVLTFSRLSAIPEFTKVDLNQVVEEVKSELSLLIEETGATVTCTKLPEVMGIQRQLGQLLSNLISNSLKFAKDRPEVSISYRVLPREEATGLPMLQAGREYIQLMVKDNGIGFEQRYADQIFNIFQRLNPREAYPGNGIGLALCKKIAENHNGTISAKSTPGQGTVMYVTLPAINT